MKLVYRGCDQSRVRAAKVRLEHFMPPKMKTNKSNNLIVNLTHFSLRFPRAIFLSSRDFFDKQVRKKLVILLDKKVTIRFFWLGVTFVLNNSLYVKKFAMTIFYAFHKSDRVSSKSDIFFVKNIFPITLEIIAFNWEDVFNTRAVVVFYLKQLSLWRGVQVSWVFVYFFLSFS